MGIGASSFKNIDQFPTLSPAAVEILSIADRPETTIEDLANLVMIDKVLYANVYKYVNSAAFALRRSPDHIEEALHYLGIYGLRDLIFMLAARKLFNHKHNWEHSLFVAYVAKKLAFKLGFKPRDASRVYISALVHDIGAMILDSEFSKEYEAIKAEENLYLRYSMEKGLFGVNSIELSCEVLTASDIPESILKIIRRQSLIHDHKSYELENALIDLAHSLAFVDPYDQRDLDDVMMQDYIKRFGLNKLDLNLNFLKKVHKELSNIIS